MSSTRRAAAARSRSRPRPSPATTATSGGCATGPATSTATSIPARRADLQSHRRLRIGLAYDLKSDYLAAGFSPEAVMEFDDEATVDALAGALDELGHRPERVGRGVELARRLAAGDRWDLVFNVAEGVSGRSREAQVPALCELFDQPYTFSDPLTSALTLDKPLAKRVVRDLGLPTAPFAVVRRCEEADAVDLPLPLFVKPI